MPCHHKPWGSGAVAGKRLPDQLLQARDQGPGLHSSSRTGGEGGERHQRRAWTLAAAPSWRDGGNRECMAERRRRRERGRGGHQILTWTVDATLARSIYDGRPPSSWTALIALQARISSPAADPEFLWSRPPESIMKTSSVFAAALLAAVSEAAVNVRCVPALAFISCQLP